MKRPNVILNEQQEQIKNEAVHWFKHESSQLFEISGLAGTGKSVLIASILYELGLNSNEVAAMSYTGQAAIVMRTKGFHLDKSGKKLTKNVPSGLKLDGSGLFTTVPAKPLAKAIPSKVLSQLFFLHIILSP